MINATCPLVTKVHNQGKRYAAQGRVLILIGHAGHPEVEGTQGQTPAPVHLVQTVADVDALEIPVETPVAYVTQTTLSVDWGAGSPTSWAPTPRISAMQHRIGRSRYGN